MFKTYILKSKLNGSYYIGSCKDLNHRVSLHNHGCVKSTKRYIPWELAYFEDYNSLAEARRRERQLKSWKKRSAIEKLINRESSIALVGL